MQAARALGRVAAWADDPVAVVLTSDERFVPGLAVTLRSLAERLDPRRLATAYVLDCGIVPSSRSLVERSLEGTSVSVEWIPVDVGRFADLPLMGHFTPAVYGSLCFAELVPPGLRRVLLLDVDLLVRRDVGELWNTDLGDDAVIAAAPDLWLGTAGDVLDPGELGELPPDTPWFNAGVQVVDVDRWRAADVGRRALALKRERGRRLPMQDQALLNVLLWDRWHRLDPAWNVVRGVWWFDGEDRSGLSPVDFRRIRRDPAIVHFTTADKPWHPVCGHPFTDEWRAARSRTALGSVDDPAWRRVGEAGRRRRLAAWIERRKLASDLFWRHRPLLRAVSARVMGRIHRR